MTIDIETLKYPIGKFKYPEHVSAEDRLEYASIIQYFPAQLRNAVYSMTDGQLDTPYRPEGWTVRQLVNHLSDSHLNAYIRFKLTLTEDQPTIKPYLEARWAELPDSESIQPAMMIIEGVHARWSVLLNSMKESDFQRAYVHPQYNRVTRLDEALALYAWHCAHHLRHITALKERHGW